MEFYELEGLYPMVFGLRVGSQPTIVSLGWGYNVRTLQYDI